MNKLVYFKTYVTRFRCLDTFWNTPIVIKTASNEDFFSNRYVSHDLHDSLNMMSYIYDYTIL